MKSSRKKKLVFWIIAGVVFVSLVLVYVFSTQLLHAAAGILNTCETTDDCELFAAPHCVTSGCSPPCGHVGEKLLPVNSTWKFLLIPLSLLANLRESQRCVGIICLMCYGLQPEETDSRAACIAGKCMVINSALYGNGVLEPSKALLIAAQSGHADSVAELIDEGANVNFRDSGTTPLLRATANGHADVVSLLLSAGAHVDAKVGNSENTALVVAANRGYTELVKILIAAGADVKGDEGSRALGQATGETRRLLIKFGAREREGR